MKNVTLIILSILSLGFTLWAFTVAYKMWKGSWKPDEVQTTVMIIVFLMLCCTYIISVTLKKGTLEIAKKESEASKIVLYENMLSTFLPLVTSNYKNESADIENKLLIIKAHSGLHGNVKVLQSLNKFHNLYTKNASAEELKASYIDLVLNMRSDLGKNNISIKENLQKLV